MDDEVELWKQLESIKRQLARLEDWLALSFALAMYNTDGPEPTLQELKKFLAKLREKDGNG